MFRKKKPLLVAVCAAKIEGTRQLDTNLHTIRSQIRDGEGIVLIPNYAAKRRDVEREFARVLGRLRDEASPPWTRTFPADGASEAWRLRHGGYLSTRTPRTTLRSYTEVARMLAADRAQVIHGVQRMDRYLKKKDGKAFKRSPYFQAWKRLGNNAFLA